MLPQFLAFVLAAVSMHYRSQRIPHAWNHFCSPTGQNNSEENESRLPFKVRRLQLMLAPPNRGIIVRLNQVWERRVGGRTIH